MRPSIGLMTPGPLHRWIRIFLPILTIPWILVFIVAIFLINPYPHGDAEEDGNAPSSSVCRRVRSRRLPRSRVPRAA